MRDSVVLKARVCFETMDFYVKDPVHGTTTGDGSFPSLPGAMPAEDLSKVVTALFNEKVRPTEILIRRSFFEVEVYVPIDETERSVREWAKAFKRSVCDAAGLYR